MWEQKDRIFLSSLQSIWAKNIRNHKTEQKDMRLVRVTFRVWGLGNHETAHQETTKLHLSRNQETTKLSSRNHPRGLGATILFKKNNRPGTFGWSSPVVTAWSRTEQRWWARSHVGPLLQNSRWQEDKVIIGWSQLSSVYFLESAC